MRGTIVVRPSRLPSSEAGEMPPPQEMAATFTPSSHRRPAPPVAEVRVSGSSHPMHAILATLGTDGDVFPHVGLGAKLRSRGHQVTLAAPQTYRSLADSLGLEFRPLIS